MGHPADAAHPGYREARHRRIPRTQAWRHPAAGSKVNFCGRRCAQSRTGRPWAFSGVQQQSNAASQPLSMAYGHGLICQE